MMALHLSDSITTIAMTARTSVSATTCAVGSPFAASGTARKDRADFKDQQDGPCGVPESILPGLDQPSPAISDNSVR